MAGSIRQSFILSVLTVGLLIMPGCATTSEISTLRTEVSGLRDDVRLAREAAQSAAADASRASDEARLAAERAASAQAQATLANEKAERVYVRSLRK